MLRKKSFKILSVLVAVIIASFSAFSLSAAEPIVVDSFIDVFSLSDVSVYYLPDGPGSSNSIDYSSDIILSKNDNQFSLKFSDDTKFGLYESFKISCIFNVKSNYLKSAISFGSFNLTISDDSSNIVFYSGVNDSLIKNVDFGLYSEQYTSFFDRMHYQKVVAIIPKNDIVGTFDSMQIDFYFFTNENIDSSDNFGFSFSGLNLDFLNADSEEIGSIIQEPGNFFYKSIEFVSDILGVIRSSPSLLVLFVGFPIVGFVFVLLYRLIRNS